VTFKAIHVLHAFSNVVFRTVVQQLTRFQLTARRAVPPLLLNFCGFNYCSVDYRPIHLFVMQYVSHVLVCYARPHQQQCGSNVWRCRKDRL